MWDKQDLVTGGCLRHAVSQDFGNESEGDGLFNHCNTLMRQDTFCFWLRFQRVQKGLAAKR